MTSNISIVIPLYNKGKYILRAINSILVQNINPDEIIIIDDGSTDEGPMVVQALNNPLIKFISQENQGVSFARNRGIEIAKGKFVAFLDADDAWKPGFLEEILKLISRFPDAGIYSTAYEVVIEDGNLIQPDFSDILTSGEEIGLIKNYFRVALKFPVCTSSTVVPKNVLKKIGGFSKCEVQGEDVDLWFRISVLYKIAWSKKPLAIYFKNAVNRSIGVRWKDEPQISKTAREYIKQGLISSFQLNDLHEYIAHFQLGAVRDCMILNRKDKAKELLQYCKGTKKFAKLWYKWYIISLLPFNPIPFLWKVKNYIKSLLT